MITELAVERVEFTCGRCGHQWSADYDVQQYRDTEGGLWEYFATDGIAVPSPYTPAGAPPCPLCGRRWVGRILARRPVPAPPGAAHTPRLRIIDRPGHRPERHGAPLLGAASHVQPEALDPLEAFEPLEADGGEAAVRDDRRGPEHGVKEVNRSWPGLPSGEKS